MHWPRSEEPELVLSEEDEESAGSLEEEIVL